MEKNTIKIEKSKLSENLMVAKDILCDYFTDFQVFPFFDQSGRDIYIELIPEDFTYCEEFTSAITSLKIDPNEYCDFHAFSCRQGLCLSDAWVPYAWSKYLNEFQSPDKLTIIHVDDHSDLMAPFIVRNDKGYIDMITKRQICWNDPSSVKNAVYSGAITIGSMLTPIVMSASHVNVIHLKQNAKTSIKRLIKTSIEDNLLIPGSKRLSVNHDALYDSQTQDFYLLTSEHGLIQNHIREDSTVALHIDMDYFNNRYNASTSWRTDGVSFNPSFSVQKTEIEKLCLELGSINAKHRIACIYIGISPSFYPSEFWKSGLSYLLKKLDEVSIDVDYLRSVFEKYFD